MRLMGRDNDELLIGGLMVTVVIIIMLMEVSTLKCQSKPIRVPSLHNNTTEAQVESEKIKGQKTIRKSIAFVQNNLHLDFQPYQGQQHPQRPSPWFATMHTTSHSLA